MKQWPSWPAALVVAIWLYAESTQANNLGFLKNTPSELLNDADRELQRVAIMTVLESENAQAEQQWKNPQSGHSGSIRSLGNYKSQDGLHCRKLRIANLTEGLKNDATYPVCKTADGEWIVASGKKLAKAT